MTKGMATVLVFHGNWSIEERDSFLDAFVTYDYPENKIIEVLNLSDDGFNKVKKALYSEEVE